MFKFFRRKHKRMTNREALAILGLKARKAKIDPGFYFAPREY